MSHVTMERVEDFINGKLKEDLKYYEQHLKQLTDESLEYTQLKHQVTTIKNHLPGDSFKTQVNIGGDFFMQAKVPSKETILVNVGLNTYVEFSLDEAERYALMKTNILDKQAEVIRDEVCKIKAHIKLCLLAIGDKTQMLRNKDVS